MEVLIGVALLGLLMASTLPNGDIKVWAFTALGTFGIIAFAG